jgi:hypothetical protein
MELLKKIQELSESGGVSQAQHYLYNCVLNGQLKSGMAEGQRESQ